MELNREDSLTSNILVKFKLCCLGHPAGNRGIETFSFQQDVLVPQYFVFVRKCLLFILCLKLFAIRSLQELNC